MTSHAHYIDDHQGTPTFSTRDLERAEQLLAEHGWPKGSRSSVLPLSRAITDQGWSWEVAVFPEGLWVEVLGTLVDHPPEGELPAYQSRTLLGVAFSSTLQLGAALRVAAAAALRQKVAGGAA